MKIQLEADEALDWIALLNENTEVDLINLNDLVRKKSFKPREEALFFGKALKDSDPTIVHHFSSDGLLYPDLEAGIFCPENLSTIFGRMGNLCCCRRISPMISTLIHLMNLQNLFTMMVQGRFATKIL